MERPRQGRPSHIDVPPYQHSQRNNPNTHPNRPSPQHRPQLQPGHISPRAGDVAPALSPLDAFAFHSSLLAKQFENEEGRRISRLPHLTVANELGKTRNGYYTPSPKTPNSERSLPSHDQSGSAPELNRPDFRPQSFYPTFANADDPRNSTLYTANPLRSVAEHPERGPQIYGQPRSLSPEPIQELPEPQEHRPYAPSYAQELNPVAPARPPIPKKTPTNDSTHSAGSGGLAPPTTIASPASGRSPRLQPSIRSVRTDSGDDTDTLSINGYHDQVRDRGPSVSSGQGRPISPFSPVFAPHRSPSLSSEHSTAQGLMPRRSQNFSRPMSPHPFGQGPRDGRPSVELLSADSPRPRPSFDTMSYQESLYSPAFPPNSSSNDGGQGVDTTDDERAIPVNMQGGPDQPSSYTYTKYTLPRGRVVSRTSISATDFFNGKFYWDSENANGAPEAEASRTTSASAAGPSTTQSRKASPNAPPAPGAVSAPTAAAQTTRPQTPPLERTPSHPEQSPAPPEPAVETPKKQARKSRFVEANLDDDLPPPKMPQARPSSSQGLTSRLPTDSSLGERPQTSSGSSKKLVRGHKSNPSFPPPTLPTKSESRLHQPNRSRDDLSLIPSLTAEKLKRQLDQTQTPARDQLAPETHLAKGIACHETGELQKSTYHLRIAARAGLPTAMLLYGLAARHGWGMRANQTEAVTWLRKAVDSAGLEVDADERSFSNAAEEARVPGQDPVEEAAKRKAHKAQLALAIYELGVSYMNGWGTPQDRALALRCFNIAGAWGDVDALTEAGFCYAKGLGCKKDMKKAAALYREVERRGVSMTGQSWIYKDKYMPKEEEDRKSRSEEKEKDKKEKKPRDKSRTRSIFSRRKTVGNTERPEMPMPS